MMLRGCVHVTQTGTPVGAEGNMDATTSCRKSFAQCLRQWPEAQSTAWLRENSGAAQLESKKTSGCSFLQKMLRQTFLFWTKFTKHPKTCYCSTFTLLLTCKQIESSFIMGHISLFHLFQSFKPNVLYLSLACCSIIRRLWRWRTRSACWWSFRRRQHRWRDDCRGTWARMSTYRSCCRRLRTSLGSTLWQ